jgi:hypothetical protein
MRFLTAALCTTVAAALLASCSGNSSPSSSVMPGANGATKIGQPLHVGRIEYAVDQRFAQVHRHGFHGRHAPSGATKGIYAGEFIPTSNNVLGYTKNNSTNGPSTCSVSTGVQGVNGIGVDTKGNLIVPMAFSGIYVYAGPGQCGSGPTVYSDTTGQAADAAALDANSLIVVGHSNGTVCTVVSGGACTTLAASNQTGFAQVAIDKSGNCYASAFDAISFTPALWVWTGCTGTGVELGSSQGFNQSSTGGLDVDNKGNLVVLEQGAPSSLTVYSGCATGTCTLVTGPTPLSGAGSNDCVYGHLGRQNENYACGDYTLGQVDVYSYLPSRTPSYKYSFNNGLVQSDIMEVAAYQPSSNSK